MNENNLFARKQVATEAPMVEDVYRSIVMQQVQQFPVNLGVDAMRNLRCILDVSGKLFLDTCYLF